MIDLVRKIFILVIVACLLVAGCAPPVPTFEPVSIQFNFPQSDQQYYESLLPLFQEKYPYINVEMVPYTSDPSDEYDVLTIPWFTTLTPNLGGIDLIPLDPFLEREIDFAEANFYPNTLDAYSWDEKQFAIPIGIDPWVMYYNKDLLDSLNLPHPQAGWSLIEFVNLGKALTDKNERTFGYAAVYFGYLDSLLFLYAFGGEIFDDSGAPTLNNPVNAQAIKWYVDLYKEDGIAPTNAKAQELYGMGQYPVYTALMDGKIGMFVAPLSARHNFFPSDQKYEWGIVPLPEGETGMTMAFYEGIGISEQSLHPDDAWKWVAFLSHQAHNTLIPARLELAQSDVFDQQVGEEVAEVGRYAMERALLLNRETLIDFNIGIDIFISMMDSLINSDLEIDRELDLAQRNAELRLP